MPREIAHDFAMKLYDQGRVQPRYIVTLKKILIARANLLSYFRDIIPADPGIMTEWERSYEEVLRWRPKELTRLGRGAGEFLDRHNSKTAHLYR